MAVDRHKAAEINICNSFILFYKVNGLTFTKVAILFDKIVVDIY